MLTMNVELWPYGDKTAAKRLVTINLANMGGSSYGVCDYVWSIDEPSPLFGEKISVQGTLKDYDRRASCVDILCAILKEYKNGVSEYMTEREIETIELMRDKTKI